MHKITAAFGVLGTIAVLCLYAAPVSAQIWLSGTGNNANDCLGPATPCRSFTGAGGALAKAIPGSTIHVLPGDYDPALINKSIQIIADGGLAFVNSNAAGGAGFVVNAGPADVVRIRGMIVNQTGTGNNVSGVGFVAGKALHLENCTLVGSPGAFGINFVPNTAAAGGVTELTVRNSTIGSNGGGNVLIKPTNAVAVAALFDGVSAGDAPFGIRADNSGGSGRIRVDVTQSVAKGHTNTGFSAVGTGSNPVQFMIDRSTADNNASFGAVAVGAQAFMIVGGSTLMGNGMGLAQRNGATVATHSNNSINFNTTNTSGTITPIALE